MKNISKSIDLLKANNMALPSPSPKLDNETKSDFALTQTCKELFKIHTESSYRIPVLFRVEHKTPSQRKDK